MKRRGDKPEGLCLSSAFTLSLQMAFNRESLFPHGIFVTFLWADKAQAHVSLCVGR